MFKNGSLVWGLLVYFRTTILSAFIAITVFLICTYETPVLTAQLIRQMSLQEGQTGTFWYLMAFLVLMYISINQVFWYSFVLGLKVRRSFFSLLVDLASTQEIYCDHVTPIASNDVIKIQAAFESLILLFLVVPSIIISLYLIVSYLGLLALIGMLALIAMLFLTQNVSKKITNRSTEVARGNQKRLYYVEFLLSRFEGICAQGLRQKIKTLIAQSRNEEFTALKKVNQLVAILNAIFTSMPFIMVVSSILPVLMVGNRIAPGSIFATMILLGTLQSSFTNLPRIVVALLQGSDSLRRLIVFVKQASAAKLTEGHHRFEQMPQIIARLRNRVCVIEGHDAKRQLDEIACYLAQSEPVAYVGHEPWLFHGSLYDNLVCDAPIDVEEMLQVLNLVGFELPEGKTPKDILISADASNLSGGQAQRIALARALLMKCDVVLLNDALRKLDSSIRVQVFNALKTSKKTLIFLSTDPQELASADLHLNGEGFHCGLSKPFQPIEMAIRNEVLSGQENMGPIISARQKATLGTYMALLGSKAFWCSVLLLMALAEGLKYYSEYLLSSSQIISASFFYWNIALVILGIAAGTLAIASIMNAALGGAEKLWQDLIKHFVEARLSITQKVSKQSYYSTFVYDQQVADQSAGNKAIALVLAVSSLAGVIVITGVSAPLLLPLYLIISISYLRYAKSFRSVCQTIAQTNSVSSGRLFARLRELSAGISLLYLGKCERDWTSKYLEQTQAELEAGLWANRYFERWLCLRLELMGVLIFGAVAWMGTNPILIGLALTYASKLPATSGRVVRLIVDLDQDLVSIGRLESDEMVSSSQESPNRPKCSSNVLQVKDLTFRYPDATRDVFKNLSFTLKKNEHLAIVGNSGSGKSTFLKLLLGMHLPTSGTVEVLEHDEIYYIPQFPIVLPASLREILHGAPDIEIQSALTTVGLAEKLENLPLERVDDLKWTPLEIQKLFLAGCLTTKASLIILDETTSNLSSFEATKILGMILQNLKAEQTLIVISHHEEVSKLAGMTYRRLSN